MSDFTSSSIATFSETPRLPCGETGPVFLRNLVDRGKREFTGSGPRQHVGIDVGGQNSHVFAPKSRISRFSTTAIV